MLIAEGTSSGLITIAVSSCDKFLENDSHSVLVISESRRRQAVHLDVNALDATRSSSENEKKNIKIT